MILIITEFFKNSNIYALFLEIFIKKEFQLITPVFNHYGHSAQYVGHLESAMRLSLEFEAV